uniref:Small ribosomal subunit protein uS15m n=1 Tax=Capra hircus TaxID=9925 RepID=A0A452EF61_CAPHI
MKFWRVRSHHAEGGVEGAEFDLNPGSDTAPSPRAAGRRGAKLLSIQQDLKSWRSHPPDHPEYATQIPVQQSQEDDPPLSMLLKDYQNIPGIAKVDDVVKRLPSLEMDNKKEMLKIKKEQLMSKVVENLKDTSSLEICSYEEHSIDKRQKMLRNLHETNYPVFEKTCKELGIEYAFPPPYHREVTKKALCIWVFQEIQKLKKQKRALKAAAAAAQKQGQRNPESPSEVRPEAIKKTQ